MLEELPGQDSRRQVFRLAAVPPDSVFLAELGLDGQGAVELSELLEQRRRVSVLEEICDAPFRRKRRLRIQTRFSDGSFPVFYSSLDAATAEAEVRHWLPTIVGQPGRPRTAHYKQFSCVFEGIEKDLRSKIDEWPDLVARSDYTFCNQLGAEARTLKIDGLVTPSARHKGTNLPIFTRGSISGPNVEADVALTYDPSTGDVAVESRPAIG